MQMFHYIHSNRMSNYEKAEALEERVQELEDTQRKMEGRCRKGWAGPLKGDLGGEEQGDPACAIVLQNDGDHYKDMAACRQECLDLGADLVSIHSARENGLVFDLIKATDDTRPTYIGVGACDDPNSCNDWSWTDASPNPFANFASGHPYSPRSCYVVDVDAKDGDAQSWREAPCEGVNGYDCMCLEWLTNAINNKIEGLEERVKKLKLEQGLSENMDKIDKEISVIQSDISDNSGLISANKNSISDNKIKIETNSDKIDMNGELISANLASISENSGEITKNENSISENKKSITGNTNSISANSDKIGENRNKIESLDTHVGICGNKYSVTKEGQVPYDSIVSETTDGSILSTTGTYTVVTSGQYRVTVSAYTRGELYVSLYQDGASPGLATLYFSRQASGDYEQGSRTVLLDLCASTKIHLQVTRCISCDLLYTQFCVELTRKSPC